MRGPGDFIAARTEERLRQSGGVRFRLAELCEDVGLMTLAFDEARALLASDATLESYPLLKREVGRAFYSDSTLIN